MRPPSPIDGAPVLDVQLTELEDDPYPWYARVRAHAEVVYVPCVNAYFVGRWANVAEALRRQDELRILDEDEATSLGGPNVLTVLNEADHASMRDPLLPTLRPAAVNATVPAIVSEICGEQPARSEAVDQRRESL
jgi:aromatic O-demethylase, cytochrome P450 subunit